MQPHNMWWKFYRKLYVFFEDRHIIGKSRALKVANLLETTVYKKIYVFINPGKCYLPLWKDETTLLKLHAQLTYKEMKNNITNKLCSSVVFLVFTLCSLNFIMEINKQQTANEQGQQFSWFIFYKKGRQITSLLL